jgi:hypothetical protein
MGIRHSGAWTLLTGWQSLALRATFEHATTVATATGADRRDPVRQTAEMTLALAGTGPGHAIDAPLAPQ